MKQSRFSEALDLIGDDSSLLALITKSVIYERIGEFTISLELADKVYKGTQDDKESIFHLRSIVNQVYAYWRLEDFDKGFKKIEEGLSLTKAPSGEYLRYISELYYVQGILHHFQNDFTRAEDNFQQAYQMRVDYGDKSLISHALNALGIVHETLGNTKKAMTTYQEALKIKENLGNPQDIARTLHNIAKIYQIQGEYEFAIDINTRGLALVEEFGSSRDIAGFLLNNASLHLGKNEAETAIRILDKVYALYEQDNFIHGMANTLAMYISAFVHLGDISSAQVKFDHLEQVYLQNKSAEYHNYYYFAAAEIKKHGSRMKDRIAALEIYQRLIDGNTLGGSQKVKTLVDICEILLEEYHFLENEEILDEVDKYLQELEAVSQKENLYYQQVQNSILRAEFNFLRGDHDISRQLLTKAQITGIEKGYQKLAKYASLKFEKLFLKNDNLLTSKDLVDITSTIESLRHDFNQTRFSKNKETPLLLLLIDIGGAPRYQHFFDSDLDIHVHLISSFLTAIISFSKEVFGQKENLIQRIDHDDYSILVSEIKEFRFAYIFKGNNYSALSHKLSLLEYVNGNKTLYDQIVHSFDDLDEKTEKKITEEITRIFPSKE